MTVHSITHILQLQDENNKLKKENEKLKDKNIVLIEDNKRLKRER